MMSTTWTALGLLSAFALCGCDAGQNNAAHGGAAGLGGDAGKGGAGATTSTTGGSASGGSGSSTGGNTSSTGGTAGPTGGAATGGGGGRAGGAGGAVTGSGGSSASGGLSSGGSAGSSPTGGSSGLAGSAGSGAGGGGLVGPGSYALPPPSQCHNQDYIDFQQGCIEGDSSSTCGGKCNTINACSESSAEKPHADLTFICPRFMLFSGEMMQAAIDDGNSDFNYAVVGHDVDRGGIDGTAESTCCQCYQLVYAYPSPNAERQVLANPDNPNPPTSAIPLPKPVIAQSFNTAATPKTFDFYMSAGGFGANNACAPGQSPQAKSGKYLYTAYPKDGQSSQGGVKPVSLYSECKTPIQWVTTESLSSEACQSRVKAACNQITSDIPGLTEQSRRSCIESNNPNSDYHMNWAVYVAKVECPEHLTQVTGCKLASQGLPAVKRNVKTAAQAAADSDFRSKTSSGSDMYETTTMEDCCRPSCAAINWISKKGLKTDSDYNAFYSCDEHGVPITQK